MGGRADESHRTAFQVRQQHVLLGFVETMNFIDKQSGRLAMQAHALAGMIRRLAQVSHIALHAAEIDEPARRALGRGMLGDQIAGRTLTF